MRSCEELMYRGFSMNWGREPSGEAYALAARLPARRAFRFDKEKDVTTLVLLDGSQSSLEAMKYAARTHSESRILLLYVAPSGREAELERGRFVLEEARRECGRISRDLEVDLRMEIGDRRSRLPEVAAEEDAALLVMGAHGVNALPHLELVSEDITELSEEIQRPVVIVLPSGQVRTAMGDETSDEADAHALSSPR
jgi:nucleotide-binding universal stress UspA family protein